MNSQSSVAYDKIKSMIFHLEFLPGTRISEMNLTGKLGLSRTPIHDAIRRLASEGLVSIENNRSAVVNCFTDEEIKEIGTIRLSQDILSAQLAAYYGSAADFDQLYRLAELCREAAVTGDVFSRIQADTDFHLKITELSRNTHLLCKQQAIYQQIHLIQISKYTNIEDSLRQIYHHVPIIEAIKNGRLNEATHLICEHVKDFFHIDPYLLKCYEGSGENEKEA